MMLPATTAWPPDFLMPRRRPSVSRPLREEPPAFLCAIALLSLRRADLGDAQHGDVLAMAVLAAAVLPAALLEDDHLIQPVLRDHRRGHGGARDGRRAQGQAALIANGQHVRERDRGAGLGFQLLDLEDRVRRNAILLPAGADDCEHGLLDFPWREPATPIIGGRSSGLRQALLGGRATRPPGSAGYSRQPAGVNDDRGQQACGARWA